MQLFQLNLLNLRTTRHHKDLVVFTWNFLIKTTKQITNSVPAEFLSKYYF